MSVPVHVVAEVLASKRIGAFQHLTLVAPGVGERFRPGTFLAASVGSPGDPAGRSHLGRRALWIHQVRPLAGTPPPCRSSSSPWGPAPGGWPASSAATASR
ncbi:hypothetical protein [Nocardioides marinisabuli]|uniref:hypothetical protein n=1 Tax=Nocardioides marinisabuli TaxID=419476 RepID=UPI0015DF4F52|nr:hypothetical protein [Nocardioides marinisabuli]